MSQNYRKSIEDLQADFNKSGRLTKDVTRQVLEELDDLRKIQTHAQELMSVDFHISLPSSGRGYKVFSIFSQLKASVSQYWDNRRKRA